MKTNKEKVKELDKRLNNLVVEAQKVERAWCLKAVEDEPLVPVACSHFSEEKKKTIRTAILCAKQNIIKRIMT